MNPKDYIDNLHEKLMDRIPRLRGAEEIIEIRDQLKGCCIEFEAAEHNRPREGFPDKLEELINKVKSCCERSDLDINLALETCGDERIQECKENFLLLWEETERYLRG